ncbi:hypothetical protein GQ600_8608 [Phytophthora cactorum]|nr:hypothetical protein GQ600_8608 [Phytophthora cactorum]
MDISDSCDNPSDETSGSRSRRPTTRGESEPLWRGTGALRRKFKSLYRKPKPSGQGEVRPAQKTIVWAKRIHAKIKSRWEGGGYPP